MKFSDFIEEGKVRKGTSDLQKVKSLIITSNNHINSIKDLEINETTAQTIMVIYYEALREIVEGLCLKEGFKVYSHEAFTYFLKEKEELVISNKFDSYRKIRNSINYYGESISVEEAKNHKEEIIKIISQLKNKYLQQNEPPS